MKIMRKKISLLSILILIAHLISPAYAKKYCRDFRNCEEAVQNYL